MKPSWPRRLFSCYRLLSRWAGLLSVALIIGAYLLALLPGVNLPANWMPYVLAVLLVGLLGLVGETVRGIDEVGRGLKELQKRSGVEFKTLEMCQRDFLGRLRESGASSVTIDQLGIDMASAWSRVVKFIEGDFIATASGLSDLTLRILVIHGGLQAREGEWSRTVDVEHWVKNVRYFEEDVARRSVEFQRIVKGVGKRLRIEVKGYTELPYVHGFAIPLEWGAYYFSLIRWVGNQFDRLDWGDDYYRVVPASEKDTPGSDLVSVFRGNFGHLWLQNAAQRLVFDSDCEPALRDWRDASPPA